MNNFIERINCFTDTRQMLGFLYHGKWLQSIISLISCCEQLPLRVSYLQIREHPLRVYNRRASN